jgi:hypothetical protein
MAGWGAPHIAEVARQWISIELRTEEARMLRRAIVTRQLSAAGQRATSDATLVFGNENDDEDLNLVLNLVSRVQYGSTNFSTFIRGVLAHPLGYTFDNGWDRVVLHGLRWTHPTFHDRGTAYNSRSFAGNLLFVGDYGS